MDTSEKYLDADFYVVMAGETPPEEIVQAMKTYHMNKVEDEDSPVVGWEGPNEARDHIPIGTNPEIDGWVNFYWPDKLHGFEPYKIGDIGFRSVENGGDWFCFPDNEKGRKHPVWKWQNPDEDPHEHLTLKPSVGLFGGDSFHCWIEDGEIRWV